MNDDKSQDKIKTLSITIRHLKNEHNVVKKQYEKNNKRIP